MNHKEQAIFNRGRMSAIATIMTRTRESEAVLDGPGLTEILMDESQKVHDDTASLLEAEIADKEKGEAAP